MFHSYCFDFSVWEMFGALLYGGKLIIPSYEVTRDVELFHDLIDNSLVTILNQTPSAFYLLDEYLKEKLGITEEEWKYIDSKISTTSWQSSRL